MDDTKQNVSTVEDVIPPIEHVTLTSKALRTKSGAPLVVLVEPMSELVIAEIMERLPGLVPTLGADAPVDKRAEIKQQLVIAPLVIEKCVAMRSAGGWQRPAFTTAETPGALPMSWLSDADKLRLLHAGLRVCGYWGPALEGLAFPDEEQQRGSDGLGNVGAGEGDGGSALAATGVHEGAAGTEAEAVAAPTAGTDGR